MQIKITTRYHLTPVRKRMAVSKNKCWQAYGEKGILVNFDKNVNWYNHYRSMKLPQKKIQNKLPYDLAILPVHLSEENKNSKLERYLHLHFHCSIIYNSQNMDKM